MKYVVKFIALIGLGFGVIYTFYINGNVSSYGFWSWALSVVVLLLTLFNVASLIAALNHSSCNEKQMLVLSSLLGFLTYCGIFFFSINQEENSDWIYLSCCFLTFLISNGFNRVTWAFVFIGFTQYIFFCWNSFVMNSWHSWAIYLFIMFIHVISIYYIIKDRLNSDSKLEPIYTIEKLGLLIPIIVIIYVLFTNNTALHIETNTLLVLSYLLLFILSSFRDYVNMFIGISVTSVIYLLIYTSDFELHLLLLIGISCTLACIMHNLHQSTMLSEIEEIKGHKVKLEKELSKVKEENDILRKNLYNEYDSEGQNIERIKDGFLGEIGRQIVRFAMDFFS